MALLQEGGAACDSRKRFAYEEKLGYAPVPDADFAKDVQSAIDREPIRNIWDE